VFFQKHRNGEAAKRFFARLFKTHGRTPRKTVTDKLGSYGVAHRELSPVVIHDTTQYANNRSELSHQPTGDRERVMKCFKSTCQAHRFFETHASVYNLFNLGRLLITASHYRKLRTNAFAEWSRALLNCADRPISASIS
jgi:putative transposase